MFYVHVPSETHAQIEHLLPVQLNTFSEFVGKILYLLNFLVIFAFNQQASNTFSEFVGYARGYTLYAFDLTPDLGEDDHFNLVREGNVRIDMKFSVALPNTINVIVYAEFENIIEIDRTRNVKFDYSE